MEDLRSHFAIRFHGWCTFKKATRTRKSRVITTSLSSSKQTFYLTRNGFSSMISFCHRNIMNSIPLLIDNPRSSNVVFVDAAENCWDCHLFLSLQRAFLMMVGFLHRYVLVRHSTRGQNDFFQCHVRMVYTRRRTTCKQFIAKRSSAADLRRTNF